MPRQLDLQKRQYRLCRLPRGYPSAAVWIQLRELPYGQRMECLAGRDSQSSESLSAGGSTRAGGMRSMSQASRGRAVRGSVDGLLHLPSKGFSNAGYQSCGSWILDFVRILPLDEQLDGRQIRSSKIHRLCADWNTRHSSLHRLPPRQCLSRDTGKLLRLPSVGLEQHQQPRTRRGRLPHDLRYLPQHHHLDSGHLQSHAVRKLRPDRSSCNSNLRPVSRKQQLHGYTDGLL